MLMQISDSGFQKLPGSCPDSDQVHVFSGNLVKQLNLFSIPTLGWPLEFRLIHNSLEISPLSDVGIGWRHNAQAYLERANSSATLIDYYDEGGRKFSFQFGSAWGLHESTFENMTLTEVGSGIWHIEYLPSGEVLEFEEASGTPILMKLVKKIDRNGNSLSYHYDAGKLQEIEDDHSGRKISLSWDGDKIEAVVDPKEYRYEFFYSDDLLTAVEMPTGCRLEYAYDEDDRIVSRTDRENASTLYTYSGNRLSQVEEPEEESVRAVHAYSLEEPVIELMASMPTTKEFKRVLYTNPRGKVWEYRFNVDGTLWRAIDPAGHQKRCYYDENQRLLYCSEGYFRTNLEDTTPYPLTEGAYFGPRDNSNNQCRRYVRDLKGNLLQAHDANGKLDHYSYDEKSRLTSVYPGQGQLCIAGQWKGHYGRDGFIFCAHNDDHSDIVSLPDYLDETEPVVLGEGGTPDLTIPVRKSFTRLTSSGEHVTSVLSHQVLEGIRPEEDGRFTQRREHGMWEAVDSSTLAFRIQLNQAQAFNLSLYTNSLDLVAKSVTTLSELFQYERFGRTIELEVVDMNGSQRFLVTQNASSIWVTFPVVGDEENPILVKATCPLSNQKPVLNAIAFDPYEDRRLLFEYDENGNLIKQVLPTEDPEREVAVEFSYNEDGTLSEVLQVEREGSTVLEERLEKMFYLDLAGNLTRHEDALNGEVAPTLFEYDSNGNVTRVTDPDGHQTQFEYDHRNRLVRWKDGTGRSTLLNYDGRGHLVSMQDALGRITEMEYSPSGRLTKLTDAAGGETHYVYELDGLLQSITDPLGNTVSFSYDDVGNLQGVTYPECDVVGSDFDRELLEPQLRFAYDCWSRLVAMTSANGNQDELSRINQLGLVNILQNPGAEVPGPKDTTLPAAWNSNYGGVTQNSAFSADGDYSFRLPTVTEYNLTDLYQRKPVAHSGCRYLMGGKVRSDSSNVSLKLAAVVRKFDNSLEAIADGPNVLSGSGVWEDTELTRVDTHGDAQVTATHSAIHQFRAEVLRTTSSGAYAVHLDELKLLQLSDAYHYDGEYLNGITARDGGQVVVYRDKFGKPQKVVDPVGREIAFRYDVRDRLLEVTDSQGLSLNYRYDFLGNLLEFEDSRGKKTTFEYDALNRLTRMTYPDELQEEVFTYSPAGDLVSYVNARGELREFTYDANHRLVGIDFHLPGPTLESLSMAYDAVGNLKRLTERNGDELRYRYDRLNRLVASIRKPAMSSNLPSWALRNVLDANSNRVELQKLGSRYGEARFGQDRYLHGEAIWRTPEGGIDSHNRRLAIVDSEEQEIGFGYDVEGRLAEVSRPNGTALADRFVYDASGRLLSRLLKDGESNLSELRYGYSLASDRVSQSHAWVEDGNCFDYLLDQSGRLHMEAVNRFVDWSPEQLAQAEARWVECTAEAKVQLIPYGDSFSGDRLNLYRWEFFTHRGFNVANNIRQDDGLHLAMSRGRSSDIGRSKPPGQPGVTSESQDYPSVSIRASDFSGATDGENYALHRLPLTGSFEINISLSDVQLQIAGVSLGITTVPFSGNSRVPWAEGTLFYSTGTSIFVWEEGTVWKASFNSQIYSFAVGEIEKVRLERFLDGSTWKLRAWHFDGTTWATETSWTRDITGSPVHTYLRLGSRNVIGHGSVRLTDYQTDKMFPVSAVDTNEAVNQATWPVLESGLFDAGRSTLWERIQWTENLPSNTDVRLQVAVSDDYQGPWEFVGPDGETDTYFTTPGGEDLPALTGRFCKYRAFLISTDGLATPDLSKVQISCEGAAGSFLKLFHYDEAGNLVEIETYTDSGMIAESRSLNDLNQITSRSGGWSFLYDDNGCLVEKTNGTGVGDEKWEYVWDQDDRLVQVSKGVYASGAVLENEFTVNYSYDSMGRMLRRDNGSEVTTFVWDGWDLLSEETDSVVTTYLVPDGLVWSFSRGEDVFQVHSDALGSVRVVTDSEGDVVARFEYGAWGELLPGSFDDVGLALCFVGGLGVRTDLETGLLYMRHRWYDAELQRFISRDPAVSGIKAAQDTITPSRGPLLANLNLYGKNNPTGFVDPTGLVPDPGPFSPPPDKIEELRRLRNPTCKIPHARHHICNALYGACWAWCLEFAITSPMNDDCIEGCYALYENCMKSGSWPTTRPWLWKQFKQPRSLPRNWLVWPFKWKWPWS